MIHDDFGTHAGHTEKLFTKIRFAFLLLYVTSDPLKDWAKQVDADIETLPNTGEYNIDEIRAAEYFFG